MNAGHAGSQTLVHAGGAGGAAGSVGVTGTGGGGVGAGGRRGADTVSVGVPAHIGVPKYIPPGWQGPELSDARTEGRRTNENVNAMEASTKPAAVCVIVELFCRRFFIGSVGYVCFN
ncbi:hypothetical protein FJZ28_02190 [Candidatus Peregrinibacteria bacterium]|nr:hypothetical protein [Candidatus Peregrinibacteria bacterium]